MNVAQTVDASTIWYDLSDASTLSHDVQADSYSGDLSPRDHDSLIELVKNDDSAAIFQDIASRLEDE